MIDELTIEPTTVRSLIEKLRSSHDFSDFYQSSSESEFDIETKSYSSSHLHDGLFEEKCNNHIEAEVKGLFEDLNLDELVDLLALAWVGRGDFEPGDLEIARDEAWERTTTPTPANLLDMPMLPEYLDLGLDSLNL